MKPLLVIAPPRCRASLLLRLLADHPGVRLVPGMTEEHFGTSLTLRGREGWNAAAPAWAWALEAWPDAHLIFLQRDQGAIEMRMMATQSRYQWIPNFGKCVGCCGQRVHDLLKSIAAFHEMHPGRTTVIDSDDLLDLASATAAIARAGIDLDPATWEREINIVTHPTKESLPDTDPADDPFHPLATLATLEKLPGSPTPPPPPDPFSDLEAALALPGSPIKPDHSNLPDMTPLPEIRLPLPPPDTRIVNPVTTRVVTIRYDKVSWFKFCVPSLESWCVRHGYQLRVVGKPRVPLPSEKFILISELRRFLASEDEIMIFIDADVIFHPEAPAWPASLTGFSIRYDLPQTSKRWSSWLARQKYATPPGWTYRNSGVWSVDRDSAARFLAVIGPRKSWKKGFFEQHHWNLWLAHAQAEGMQIRDLPEEWNRLANYETAPGWLYHLAGKKKEVILAKIHARGQLPMAPRKFIEHPAPETPAALAWLWRSSDARWEEFRYSLRSALANFEDMPIHIFGDTRPAWLLDHPRIHFHLAPGYEEALAGALQCAERVILMNDDIYFLRPCRLDDMREALVSSPRRDLRWKAPDYLTDTNTWWVGVGRSIAALMHRGFTAPIRTFSTHTPYLFEREKSLEILRIYGIWRKMPFELLYHNHHATPTRPIEGRKIATLPPGDSWYLNHPDGGLTPEIREGLMELFPNPAPWESDAAF